MKWQVRTAKNGEATLMLNDIAIYSNYRPYNDAERWVRAEINTNVSSYILIGLGLGYHLQALSKATNGKHITVYFFDENEYKLFREHNSEEWWNCSHIKIVNDLEDENLNENVQILVPNVWLKAIGIEHSLFNLLEVIKINQISYKKSSAKMIENFQQNIKLSDSIIKKLYSKRIACLVAAGPSLNKTVNWLKKNQYKVDIYAVGAALRVLIDNKVSPKAVVLSDPSDKTFLQFEGLNYRGDLYYLSTASYYSVNRHKGKRYIMFQEGYSLAEQQATILNSPLIETGGSVGTTTFSLLEKLGYGQVVLFGQDLGFAGNQTHATLSSSRRDAQNDIFLRNIEANDGSFINTNAMFQSFWYWYDRKCSRTTIKVYNTASKGAKISSVPLINEQQFEEMIHMKSNL